MVDHLTDTRPSWQLIRGKMARVDFYPSLFTIVVEKKTMF